MMFHHNDCWIVDCQNLLTMAETWKMRGMKSLGPSSEFDFWNSSGDLSAEKTFCDVGEVGCSIGSGV